MTTFNFKNYRVEPAPDPGLPKETVTPGVPDQTNTVQQVTQQTEIADAANATTGLDSVKVMVTGPISEIIANALNGVFKNSALTMYDEESMMHTKSKSYILSLEENAGELIDNTPVIYCVNVSNINANPVDYNRELNNVVKKFSAEANKSIYLYINTEGRLFSGAKEELFLVNVPKVVKKMFFSVNATVEHIKSLVKAK